MSSVPVRTIDGGSAGEVELADGWFAGQINVPAMHQVVVAQMAARRGGNHKVKGKGEVRGGGRKPHRQKGTGRARQGSIRSPQYVGGGVVHGPVVRDHSKSVNKRVRAVALRSALSDRAGQGKVAVFEGFPFEEPKTKAALSALGSAEIEGTALIVVAETSVNITKSFKNLPNAHVLHVGQLNTYDILARDWIVFDKAAVEQINARPAPVTRKEANA